MSVSNRHSVLESWARVLAGRVPDGVAVVSGRGAVLLANSAASQLLEAPTEEELQLAVDDLLQRMGDATRIEVPVSGRRRGLIAERVTLDGTGPRDGCMLVVQDAAQLEATDTDLLLANRMRSLENLYRALAHDLKSPLQAIVLNVDLLRELAREADDDDRVRMETHLEVIQGEISRLGRSIQSLLAQTGPGSNAKRRVDLRRIQREIVTLVEPVARRKKMRIDVTAPKHAVGVLGHRDRIKQAVLNLAVNAIEAVERRGTLEFDLRSDGAAATFEVRDDGPGIPPELESRIFDSHFTTKPTGSGIGLGVALSVARAHDGDLQLLCREPRGTIARLTLPLVEKGA